MFAMVGQILIGWLLADFFSGLGHWWMDGADPKMPVIGPRVILANLEHHDDPLDFLGATVLKRNFALWVATVLISLLWLIFLGPSWVWVSATVMSALAGEVHVLSHTRGDDSLWVRCLRATGLLQSPGEHARHHRLPNKSNYCVITNWLNPLLDGIGFWRVLDKMIGR